MMDLSPSSSNHKYQYIHNNTRYPSACFLYFSIDKRRNVWFSRILQSQKPREERMWWLKDLYDEYRVACNIAIGVFICLIVAPVLMWGGFTLSLPAFSGKESFEFVSAVGCCLICLSASIYIALPFFVLSYFKMLLIEQVIAALRKEHQRQLDQLRKKMVDELKAVQHRGDR